MVRRTISGIVSDINLLYFVGLSSSNLDSAYKPPALNLSLTSSSSCDGTTGKASLTSPTTPVLTSPETSVQTTPIVTSTKHLGKIDINSPTSTFGKKLAALHNPGKLLPCKGNFNASNSFVATLLCRARAYSH